MTTSTILKEKGVNFLYHFTDIRNLNNIIKSGGIYSKDYLRNNNISFVPCGNEKSHLLDAKVGNNSFICLSYTPYLPMMYGRKRIQHLCLFRFPVEIVDYDLEIDYTDTNSVNHLAKRNGPAMIDLINFPAIKAMSPYSSERRWHSQAEVLVRNGLSLKFIDSISFLSEYSLSFLQYNIPSLNNFNCVVDPVDFVDDPARDKMPSIQRIEKIYVGSAIDLDYHAMSNVFVAKIDKNSKELSIVVFLRDFVGEFRITRDKIEVYKDIIYSGTRIKEIVVATNSILVDGKAYLYFFLGTALWGKVVVMVDD